MTLIEQSLTLSGQNRSRSSRGLKMARSKTKVELARGYPHFEHTPVGKAHMHLEIALVGHEYDGQRINSYELVQMIERDIQRLISERSHGLVTTRLRGSSIRECELWQINDENDCAT